VFLTRDACELAEVVSAPVDFVLIANTFHGVPDKTLLAQAVAEVLAPGGHLAIVNWHRRPREETTVFGQPRGPKTDLRMTPDEVQAAVRRPVSCTSARSSCRPITMARSSRNPRPEAGAELTDAARRSGRHTSRRASSWP
jgi:SAM-dependent methyltransferase